MIRNFLSNSGKGLGTTDVLPVGEFRGGVLHNLNRLVQETILRI